MMTRWVFALLAVAFVLPVSQSFASDARTDGLAVQREYLEDYVNFRTFPTVVARYKNLLSAGLGSRGSMNYTVGAIGAGDNTDYGVFAVFLNNVRNGANLDQQAQIDLAWAKEMANVDVGAALLWQRSSEQDNNSRDKTTPIARAADDVNQFSLTGGIKFNGDNTALELAGEVAFLTWEETVAGAVTDTDDGKISYRLSARIMNEMSSRTTLVPLFQYTHTDFTPITDSPTIAPPADNVFTNAMNLGVALHHEVNGDDLLILGIAANYRKDQSLAGGLVQEETLWDLPALFMALEFDVYSWLTARVGATKTIDRANDKVDGGTATDTENLESRYFFGLGMGLHFDNFDLDATVDPQAMFSGGYLFSGEQTAPLTSITGTYYW